MAEPRPTRATARSPREQARPLPPPRRVAGAGIRETAIVTDDRTHGIRDAVSDGRPEAWTSTCRRRRADGRPHLPAVADFVGCGPGRSSCTATSCSTRSSRRSSRRVRGPHARCPRDARRAPRRAALDRLLPARRRTLPGPAPRGAAALGDGCSRACGRLGRADRGARRRRLPAVPGRIDGLLATNRRLLEAIPADQRGERVFDSELQGRVAIWTHPPRYTAASSAAPWRSGPGAHHERLRRPLHLDRRGRPASTPSRSSTPSSWTAPSSASWASASKGASSAPTRG